MWKTTLADRHQSTLKPIQEQEYVPNTIHMLIIANSYLYLIRNISLLFFLEISFL